MESLTRPSHRRKLSNTNGYSFPVKNAYDDVFRGPPAKKCGTSSFSPGLNDYSEIFSGSRGSSIPMLDLSVLDEGKGSGDYPSSKLDYSKIFGGFRGEDTAVPYEELFAAAKKGKFSSGKGRSLGPIVVGNQYP